MTDLFATYESDFQLALQEAKSKLALITSVEGGMYLGRRGLRELTKGYYRRDKNSRGIIYDCYRNLGSPMEYKP